MRLLDSRVGIRTGLQVRGEASAGLQRRVVEVLERLLLDARP